MRHQQPPLKRQRRKKPKVRKKKYKALYVTGSRLKRLDLDTPAPVTIVTKQQIEASGLVNIGEVLQQLPQVGGTNLQVNNGGTGSVTSNIRGYQTVILLNGRRMVGPSVSSSVDMSMIPLAVVERVEILKWCIRDLRCGRCRWCYQHHHQGRLRRC